MEANHRGGHAEVCNLLAKCEVCHMGLLSAALPLGKYGEAQASFEVKSSLSSSV